MLILRDAVAGEPNDPVPEDIDPLMWQIYRRRGISGRGELDRDLAQLIPPVALSGLDAATALLCEAIRASRRILIVGDFDADGATSCALALTALRAFGHTAADYLVPNRFEFGYGLTPEIVEHARSRRPDLLITVDNGIASVDGVASARKLGWQVIVTDHHLPGDALPDANAIVNPNLSGDAFASKALAGVGVIFYVMAALRARLREQGWFAHLGIPEPVMADLLDLVALGTVADVVPLDRNNRILVHNGLRQIRAGRCRPGISALLRVADRDPSRVQATDLGFAAGPRLNAAGRLDDMSLGIACLLAEDDETAMRHALGLDGLNRERRAIEGRMKQEAEDLLADWQADEGERLPWGLCLNKPDWHQGVIGIVAARVRERYHRPVIVFASVGNGMIKGSGRSIPGLHMRDALDLVAKRKPRLLSRFGGHAMAAGLSIREADFDAFADAFDAVVHELLDEGSLSPTLLTDGGIPGGRLTLETARMIADGGPWGQGFPEPLFDGRFDVLDARTVGEAHWKLVLRPCDSDVVVDAIAFRAVEDWPELPEQIHAAYRLDENTWQGRVSLQLRLEAIAKADASQTELV